MNYLCDLCIECMEWWANNTFLTYGEINIILFVILQPLLIICGFVLSIIGVSTNNIKVKKRIKNFAISVLIFGVIFTFSILFIPFFDVVLKLKY